MQEHAITDRRLHVETATANVQTRMEVGISIACKGIAASLAPCPEQYACQQHESYGQQAE